MLRIIFAGTTEFAVPTLKILLEHHNVLAVITAPDKPTGRGRKVKPSPVKEMVFEWAGVPILTRPINKLVKHLTELKPDLIVVTAYGQLLSKEILAIPRYGALNIHPSLLPKYRGASPIQAAILNGDAEIGVTIIRLTNDLDAGPIISQKKIALSSDATTDLLHDELAKIGAELLQETLEKGPVFDGILQNESRASYTKKITPTDAELDCKDSAVILERKVRAYNPAPGAYIKIQSSTLKALGVKVQNCGRLKIFRAYIKKDASQFSEGAPFIINDGCPAIMCADRELLVLTEVQPEGRGRMKGADFANGYLSARP